MLEKKDYFEECYDGPWRKGSTEEFKQVYCKTCRTPDCVNTVLGAMTKWEARMATQVDRLFENPRFSSLEIPKHAQIHNLDFPTLLHKAKKIMVAAQKDDWTIPTEAEIEAVSVGNGSSKTVEDAVRALRQDVPTLVEEPKPLMPEAPSIVEPSKVTQPPPRIKSQGGGIMIGGDAPPVRNTSIRIPKKDPWAVSDEKKVAVGAKIKLGGPK